MNSKTIALILGPSLAIVLLLVGYWVKTRQQEPGAPLELHAGLQTPGAIISPPSMIATTDSLKEPAPSATQAVPAEPSVPAVSTPAVSAPELPAPAPSLAASTAPVSAPKFDVVRVEPSGEAVVAGHTEPDTHVAVVANGKVIAEGQSDAGGQFVLLPPPLPPGEHALTLQVTPPSGPVVVSDQNVAVSVPVKGKGDVMVALAEPGKATVLLADPTAKAEPPKAQPPKVESPKIETPRAETSAAVAPKEDPKPVTPPIKSTVSIKTAEIVEPGGFFVTGVATPGAHVRLYLNGSGIADVTAGPDGAWTVKVGKGLVAGHYDVRADLIDGSGVVVARAEVPFDYAAAKAEVAAVVPPAPTPAQPASAAKEPGTKASAKASTSGQESGTKTSSNSEVAQPAPSTAAPDVDQTQQPGAAAMPKTANAAPSPSTGATAVVAEIQTATVEKGNSLWRISRITLGHGMRYTEIYAANSSQIRDPKLIYPGQVFVIPNQTN